MRKLSRTILIEAANASAMQHKVFSMKNKFIALLQRQLARLQLFELNCGKKLHIYNEYK